MLSGTFLANKWHDIFGVLDLLPGYPFRNQNIHANIWEQVLRKVGRAISSEASMPCEVSNGVHDRQAIEVAKPFWQRDH